MVSFEIYFHDLSEKAQRELMELVHIDHPSEMNWDIAMCPLAVYETEEFPEDTPEWMEPNEGFTVMMQAGKVRHEFMTFKTKEEAVHFCKENHWEWADENEFVWDLYIDE